MKVGEKARRENPDLTNSNPVVGDRDCGLS